MAISQDVRTQARNIIQRELDLPRSEATRIAKDAGDKTLEAIVLSESPESICQQLVSDGPVEDSIDDVEEED